MDNVDNVVEKPFDNLWKGGGRMNLPSQFLQRMEAMLGDEFAAFEQSFHRERYSGLRANLLKTSVF